MTAPLLPRHQEMLTASAISPEVAARRGYWSATTKDELDHLDFGPNQVKGIGLPALVIPQWSPAGEQVGHQVRPDVPRRNANGDPIKYESPTRSAPVLDVPPACRSQLRDVETALWITEGSRKADAAASKGLCCISLPGVWGWKRDGVANISWDEILLRERTVYLAFDSDVLTKPEVRKALDRLRLFLTGRGAAVLVVVLPPGEGGRKVGLDDYLAAGGSILDLIQPATDELPSPPDGEGGGGKGSPATVLIALARDACELFTETGTNTAYATVTVGDVRQTLPLRGETFKAWLAQVYYAAYQKAVGRQAMQDAITTLIGVALHEGESHQVHVRIAHTDDAIWLDLGGPMWEAVRITPDGWKVVPSARVPVKFRRPNGLLELPTPDPAGHLRELAAITDRGTADEADLDRLRLMLANAFLLGVFQPAGGRVVLELLGEAGSGKTELAQMLRKIVDPNKAPLRAMPRTEDDLVIAAMNGTVCGFDNVSELRESMSDAFCRLTTGAGISKRQLYTDADEVILDAQRPIILTGITSVVTRGDLGSRTITIDLPRIDADQRRTEAEIEAEFELARPRLLGGLLHAVSMAMQRRHTITIANLPRLADFALWVEAAAPALDWEPGDFAAAFEATRLDADWTAIESTPVGPVLARFIDAEHQGDRWINGTWTGTPSDLLACLVERATEDERKESGWPKNANRLSRLLKRLGPNLRQFGARIDRGRTGAHRELTIHKNKDAWLRHYRHSRHEQPENPRNDAKTGGDASGAPLRHVASPVASPAQQSVWGNQNGHHSENPSTGNGFVAYDVGRGDASDANDASDATLHTKSDDDAWPPDDEAEPEPDEAEHAESVDAFEESWI